MPAVGFEHTISAGERPQTDALDGAATGTGVLVTFRWANRVCAVQAEMHEDILFGKTCLKSLGSPYMWVLFVISDEHVRDSSLSSKQCLMSVTLITFV